MALQRQLVNRDGFNDALALPYDLCRNDFADSMDDLYIALANFNYALLGRRLTRLEDAVRSTIFSGMLSDLLVKAISRYATGVTLNIYPNERPSLIPVEHNPHDSPEAAKEGVEVKATTRSEGAAIVRGGWLGWYCVFRYSVDRETSPASARAPTRFTDIWLAKLTEDDFRRKSSRAALGTNVRRKLREGWLYHDPG
jgi:hypothetical protein